MKRSKLLAGFISLTLIYWCAANAWAQSYEFESLLSSQGGLNTFTVRPTINNHGTVAFIVPAGWSPAAQAAGITGNVLVVDRGSFAELFDLDLIGPFCCIFPYMNDNQVVVAMSGTGLYLIHGPFFGTFEQIATYDPNGGTGDFRTITEWSMNNHEQVAALVQLNSFEYA